MNPFRFGRFSRTITSALCVVLVFNLVILTPGCGTRFDWRGPMAGQVSIPLTPDHPISKALSGTAFEGAESLEADMDAGTFRLVFPDDARTITGRFVRSGDSWEMTEFSFGTSAGAAKMSLDAVSRQVTMIETTQGDIWTPSKISDAPSRAVSGDRIESYVQSNAELMPQTDGSGKGNSSLLFAAPFFFFVMFIWSLCAVHVVLCPGFLPIFLVIGAILGGLPPPNAGEQQIPQNQAPDARDDAFTTPHNTTINASVLTDNGAGADSDPDGDPLTVSLVTSVANGTLSLQPDGLFTYTPNTGFVGADTFVYRLEDGQGGTDNATVTITVTNLPPDARDDAFSTLIESLLTGNLFDDNGMGIDSDPDGDAITVTAVDGSAANVGTAYMLASGAILTVMPDGSFTYNTAVPLIFGKVDSFDDTFTYTISDGVGGTDTATVVITVDLFQR